MWRAFGFVLKFVTRPAHACTTGVSALDHAVGNHAVKNSAVRQRSGAAFAADAVFPVTLALGKVCEFFHGNGGLGFEEAADNVSFRRAKDCVSTGLAGHKFLSYFVGVEEIGGLFFCAPVVPAEFFESVLPA